MTIIGIIILLAVAFLAWFIINTFFKEPIKTPAFVIMGVILLIILIGRFVPEVGSYRIWH
jgi:uncharacterized membrane protein (UPF0182 family)